MDKEQFLEKIDAIGKSVMKASRFFDAYKDMSEATSNENLLKHMNLAPTFFKITADALFLGIFSETAKLFDYHKDAYGIKKFLNVCEQQLYKLPRFYEPTGEHDPLYIKTVIQSLKNELDELSCIIDNLSSIRDKYYAHLDKKHMNNFQGVINEFPISSLYDLKKLIDFAAKVLNEVRSYLTGTNLTYSHNVTDLPNFLRGLHQATQDVWGNDISDEIDKIVYRKNPNSLTS